MTSVNPSLRRKVLIVDDDPSHIEIYSLLVRQTGYEAVPALVRFTGVEFPADDNIDAAILDYRLNCLRTSTELAQEIRIRFPDTPIILLSDGWNLPTEIAPYVTDFVRRGEPASLLEKLCLRLSPLNDTVPLLPCIDSAAYRPY